ncbi:IrrE-like protein [Gordonia phage Finkle]|uniref:IrrE-like protein n=1 Tax=Gordonia phage Finkle TaxID=2926099 RepID=A0A9E7SZC5_9CAUD|nr:IrrE-like protein [Gordonia phage Finkle]UTN92961.1 IrrE-like protein [Gordonia phage Finkle]
MSIHNPWRYLAEHHPDVRVVWTRLDGVHRGFTDGRTIWMDNRLSQAQRRITVCHETFHIERGIIPADAIEEARVERLTAERLITTDQLIDALRWHRHRPSLQGLAETLWVDVPTVQCRLKTMNVTEQRWVNAMLRGAAA